MNVRRIAEVDDKVYEAVCCEVVCEEVHEAKIPEDPGSAPSILVYAWWPGDVDDLCWMLGEARLQIEEPMSNIPQTYSVAELARFCDTHDLTEFEYELEEVKAPVFARANETVLQVALPPTEAAALHRAAQSKGVEDTELVREWLSEKLRAS